MSGLIQVVKNNRFVVKTTLIKVHKIIAQSLTAWCQIIKREYFAIGCIRQTNIL